MLRATKRSPALWRALASPRRRRILDLLRDGPRTTGEIASAFRSLSRFAVMQHLDVLTDARLVLVRREGRFRLNYLNAVPLVQAYERWVSTYAAPLAHASVALKRFAEGGPSMPQTSTEARAFVYVVRPPRNTFAHDATAQERRVVAEHFEYLRRLCGKGTVVLAGRCDDATFGLVVFEASDESAARALMNADPAVNAGVLSAQLHPFRIALLRGARAEESQA